MNRSTTLAALCALALSAGANAGQWDYLTRGEKMTGKSEHTATLQSDTSLAFAWPYNGRNMGVILVRKHPEYGTNVIVTIEKGQILCRTYDPCTVSVKFDNKAPMRFSGTPPADHRSTAVFLTPTARFIAEASKAKTILVQLNVYQQGSPVIEFSAVTPLAWKPGK